EVRRLQQADGRERAEVHEQRTVSVDDEDARVRPGERQAETDRRGDAHAAPGVEILRPIAGREQIVRGMAEARDDPRVAGPVPLHTWAIGSIHDAVPRRGSSKAPACRVPNAVVAMSRTASAAASPEVTVMCGSPTASKIARTARPIGT